MPIDWNLDLGGIAALERSGLEAQSYLDAQRAEAIRWQGAQEYESLIQAGVAPRDAFARTAPKLLYNEPKALAAALPDIQGQGELFYDENGRQFIKDPSGKIRHVPSQWTGSTTVMGANGQIYKIPLTPPELAAAPRTSVPPPTPRVETAPGGQEFIVQPGGTGTQLRPRSGATVKIKDEELKAEYEIPIEQYKLRLAEKAAAPLRKQWEANNAKILAAQEGLTGEAATKAGKAEKFGPDWLPGLQTYAAANAELEKQLKEIGFDTAGNVIPGSRLAAEIGQAAAQQPTLPGGGAVAPPAEVVAPTLPVAPPGFQGTSQFIYNTPTGLATNTYLGRNLVRPGAATQAATPLASNEILRMVRGRPAIYDAVTRKFIRYAD